MNVLTSALNLANWNFIKAWAMKNLIFVWYSQTVIHVPVLCKKLFPLLKYNEPPPPSTLQSGASCFETQLFGGFSRGCSMFKRRGTREPSDSTISRRGKLNFCTKMEGPKIIWALEVWKIGLNFGICRPSISEVYCLFNVRLFHKSRKMTVKCVTIALLAISKLLIFYTLTVSNNNRKSIHAQTFSKSASVWNHQLDKLQNHEQNMICSIDGWLFKAAY